MRTRGFGLLFVAIVLASASACVAEPGSSWAPTPVATVAPTRAPGSPSPSPSPTPDSSSEDVEPTPAAAPSPWTGATILTLEGTGSVRSGPFDVDEDWAISWQRTGERLFSIQLIPAEVDVFGELVVSTVEPTAGSSPMYRPGRFVVQVYASEPWTFRIFDLPPMPVRPLPGSASGSGPTNTEVFSGDGRFLIEWTADRAVPFGIELVTMTTGEPLLVAVAAQVESSCHVVSVADEFYLHVVTDARWNVTLRPVEGEVVCPAD